MPSLILKFTKFSHNYTAHNEETPKELKTADFSLEDELIKTGRHDGPEAAEHGPDGRWDQDEAGQVDVVIDGVDDGRNEEFEGSFYGLFV